MDSLYDNVQKQWLPKRPMMDASRASAPIIMQIDARISGK